MTVKLVESIPSVNAALFAALPPGGKLGKHRDPFAGSLRYHLGLVTPNSDDCRIYVDGDRYSWRDGEDVVFDQTFMHWARDDTDEVRIILFCDIDRPIRNPLVRRLNKFVTWHMARVTASHNVASEPIGAANHLAAAIYWIKRNSLALKKASKPVYYAGKYLLIGAALYLLFLAIT